MPLQTIKDVFTTRAESGSGAMQIQSLHRPHSAAEIAPSSLAEATACAAAVLRILRDPESVKEGTTCFGDAFCVGETVRTKPTTEEGVTQ